MMRGYIFISTLVLSLSLSAHKEGEALPSPEERAADLMAQFVQVDPLERALTARGQWFISPEEIAETTMEGRDVTYRVNNDPEFDPKVILEEVRQDLEEAARDDKEKRLATLRAQNELLSSPDYSVGLYKSDFVKGSFLLSNIFADVALFRNLTQRRVEKILISMKEDIIELIRILEQAKASEDRYDERLEQLNPIARAQQRLANSKDAFLNPLRRYIDEKHVLMSWRMPFNKATVFPLLMRFGWEKLSSFAEAKLIEPVQYTDHLDEDLSQAHACAFRRNAQGVLTPLEWHESPFSVTGVLKIARAFFDPASLTRDALAEGQLRRLGVVNKLFGFKIPDFVFSDTAKFAFDVFGMGLSAKFYDTVNCYRWKTFVIVNREKLLRKLRAYRRALDQTDESVEAITKAETSLKKFIIKGHQSSSWLPWIPVQEWWEQRDAGQNYIPSRLGFLMFGMGAYKLAKWWWGAGNNEQPQN
jgi:hypothetical protein